MSLPVSIIIPTFNRAHFLVRAIDSVLSQTYQDFELIIVDDGSNDNTKEIVEKYADQRIKYIYQENKGVAAARNLGVANSNGEYLAFLDSDDLWMEKKLEVQKGLLDSQAGISVCQTEEIWLRNGVRANPCKKHAKKSGWIFKYCLPLCIISPSAVMMKKSVFEELGGFDESFKICEDYELWLRMTLRYEFVTMQEALIVKRGGHEGQLSKVWGQDLERVRALEKILDDPILCLEDRRLVSSEIIKKSRIIANGARKRGKLDVAEEYERKTVNNR